MDPLFAVINFGNCQTNPFKFGCAEVTNGQPSFQQINGAVGAAVPIGNFPSASLSAANSNIPYTIVYTGGMQ